MDDFEKIINSLSDKEVILRVDLKQNIKVINFKIGSMDINGELGISFRSINPEKKAEEIPENIIEVPEEVSEAAEKVEEKLKI
ncbi:hypothetical protein [Methanococcus maripaludis]|jgi:hypothetical protein|uniref:Uncharacterized protein n=5 Tax=Methanococcus maripaludis TaxID=39152 RepID=Q6M098_METMP|nr:hypothetical protein [Methanococcus maripaludis]AEK19272.1 hypothetical protein GYY_01925 [Methanococcus maripaludis X1]AVB76118.1 hypothetical protein MMJJ_07040 [Methanococcus maripaludis]MBA2840776.1 hypothetical protein [Methanococcus maripaludis]MBA2846158.1 hypothetical protein [Methanococcus maripaludis]MBA2851410.1 hypothetical protein [Methanococcus maripaludis]